MAMAEHEEIFIRDNDERPGSVKDRGTRTAYDVSGRSSTIASSGREGGKRHNFILTSKLPSVRPFYGIIQDVKSRAPYYASDWTDAWNYRVVPATLLIFFAK